MMEIGAQRAQFSGMQQNDDRQRKRKSQNFNKNRGGNRNKFFYSPQADEPCPKVMIQISHQTIKKNNFNWTPKTSLGNLVLSGKIRNIEEILLHNMRITEPEIVDYLFSNSVLKEEVLTIKPVIITRSNGTIQKSFKVIVIVGDYNGHVGIGFKAASEIADAIKDAKKLAKMSIIPVFRGSWQINDYSLHTVNKPIHGSYGSIQMKLMPAPKGTGIVSCWPVKKLLEMAGFKDVFTSSCGHAKSTFNFLVATLKAIQTEFQAHLLLAQKQEEERNMSRMIPVSSNKMISTSKFNYQLTREIIQ